jgi:hypothetical protein
MLSRCTLSHCLVSMSLAAGLLWVASPLVLAQKNAIRSNLQKETFSRSHLRQLNFAILRYLVDNDSVYPALNSPKKLREQFNKMYVSTANLTCPFANKPYAMNAGLAGKKRSSVKEPHRTLLFWSTAQIPGGGHLVLDAGGTVKRLSSAEFSRMKRN